MILLGVNYHYFTTSAPVAPRSIFPLTPEALAAQLDLLARAFEPVSLAQVVAAAAGEVSLPERGCLITFDDGLRSQVELALPVLEARGWPAAFFPCAMPLMESRAIRVHKQHWLRERVPDRELLAEIEREAGGLDELRARIRADALATYHYDDEETAHVKFLLNGGLEPSVAERVVDRVFARVHGDEPAFCDELYLSAEQLRALAARGWLGGHSYSHELLSLMPEEECRRDLERSATVLEELAGARPRAMSYPYGTAAAVTAEVGRSAAAAGYVAGFSTERAFNTTLSDPLLLARIDTNDAPGGKGPRFEIDGDGALVLSERITPSRRRYFTEPE